MLTGRLDRNLRLAYWVRKFPLLRSAFQLHLRSGEADGLVRYYRSSCCGCRDLLIGGWALWYFGLVNFVFSHGLPVFKHEIDAMK